MIAIYKRLSMSDGDLGEEGKDSSNSIETQGELIKAYINNHSEFLNVPHQEFTDDGYTGTNFNRPGFQQMMTYVKRGEVDTIIVKDLSRFGRDYVAVGEYLEQIFPVLGVRFIAINNAFDSANYRGTTIGFDMAVSNVINTLYSRDVGKKLRSANEVKWKKGCTTGGFALFGYVFDPDNPNHYKIDPDAAKIVRRIYDLALLGYSTCRIANALNDEGYPIPSTYAAMKGYAGKKNQRVLTSDKLWDSAKVWRALNYYEYTGAMVRNKSRVVVSGSNLQRKQPRSEHIVVENCHEAIVTKEEWEAAQAVIKGKSPASKVNHMDFALRGKLRCGHCKRVLSFHKTSEGLKVYCRDGIEQSRHSGCSSDYYMEKDIEDLVYRSVKLQIEMLLQMKVKIAESQTVAEEMQRKQKTRKERLYAELSGLKGDKIRLYEDFVAKQMDADTYISRKTVLDAKIDEIAASLADMEESIRAAENERKSVNSPEIRGLISESERLLGTDHLTAEMADAFIENVYVYPDKRIEIIFRYQDIIEETLKLLENDPQNNQNCG